MEHRRTIDQLINLERRISFGTGRDTVGHPPGCHGDLAVAVAGAITLAATRRPQMRVGTYNPMGGDGRIHWKDEEPKTRVRVQWYSPEEARELKEKGQW